MEKIYGSNTFADFTRHYRAQVRQSRTPYYEAGYASYQYKWDDNPYEQTIGTRTVPAVEITMPEKDFFRLIEMGDIINNPNSEWHEFKNLCRYYGPSWLTEFVDQKRKEAREQELRESIPALQSAWEQYQFTLELLK
jgi:hypothetical protein